VNHEDIRVNEVVSDVERLLRRTIGENINLELSLDPEAGHVTIDRTQLEQVIVNLAVNAKDAMPGGGRLQIKTKVENFAEVSARHPGIGRSRYVGLSVIDTGEGMSPDVQDRAFEPFFTTKARGEGTGLGLATVFGVVQGAGGVLEIDSSPGSGTAVTAFFPRKENGYSSADGVTAVQNGRHGGGQTILVVEDEEAVRRLVQRILDRNGYEVLVAQSGKAALELVAAHDGEIDLLLTDVVMPQMSGKELASRFGEAGYSFPTLFMSGYTDQIMSRDGQLSGDEDLILKPFDSGSLLSKIAKTLSSR
jgi:CheY-like chemotaxis protein